MVFELYLKYTQNSVNESSVASQECHHETLNRIEHEIPSNEVQCIECPQTMCKFAVAVSGTELPQAFTFLPTKRKENSDQEVS